MVAVVVVGGEGLVSKGTEGVGGDPKAREAAPFLARGEKNLVVASKIQKAALPVYERGTNVHARK